MKKALVKGRWSFRPYIATVNGVVGDGYEVFRKGERTWSKGWVQQSTDKSCWVFSSDRHAIDASSDLDSVLEIIVARLDQQYPEKIYG
jgi:hypothetical protein